MIKRILSPSSELEVGAGKRVNLNKILPKEFYKKQTESTIFICKRTLEFELIDLKFKVREPYLIPHYKYKS